MVSPVQGLLMNQEGNYEVSTYNGSKADPTCIAMQIIRLKRAFPKMSDDFFDLLSERIDQNSFTEKKITDAMQHGILSDDSLIIENHTILKYSILPRCDIEIKYMESFPEYQ